MTMTTITYRKFRGAYADLIIGSDGVVAGVNVGTGWYVTTDEVGPIIECEPRGYVTPEQIAEAI